MNSKERLKDTEKQEKSLNGTNDDDQSNEESFGQVAQLQNHKKLYSSDPILDRNQLVSTNLSH